MSWLYQPLLPSVAGSVAATGYTLNFATYLSTSFDAIPALTLRVGPTGKMSVRADGKPAQLAAGVTFVAYSLARGAEAIESVTFLSSTFFGQGGMVVRFNWTGADLTGYRISPNGSSTSYRVAKTIDNVDTGFGATDFTDFTFPNGTDPITWTCQTVGAAVVIKAYQNNTLIGTFTDDSASRLLTGDYGIFGTNNSYDPSMPLTYVKTGYVAPGPSTRVKPRSSYWL